MFRRSADAASDRKRKADVESDPINGHLSIVVVYAPTEDSAADDEDNFYNQVHSLMGTISSHDPLVLLGDFNAIPVQIAPASRP